MRTTPPGRAIAHESVNTRPSQLGTHVSMPALHFRRAAVGGAVWGAGQGRLDTASGPQHLSFHPAAASVFPTPRSAHFPQQLSQSRGQAVGGVSSGLAAVPFRAEPPPPFQYHSDPKAGPPALPCPLHTNRYGPAALPGACPAPHLRLTSRRQIQRG